MGIAAASAASPRATTTKTVRENSAFQCPEKSWEWERQTEEQKKASRFVVCIFFLGSDLQSMFQRLFCARSWRILPKWPHSRSLPLALCVCVPAIPLVPPCFFCSWSHWSSMLLLFVESPDVTGVVQGVWVRTSQKKNGSKGETTAVTDLSRETLWKKNFRDTSLVCVFVC